MNRLLFTFVLGLVVFGASGIVCAADVPTSFPKLKEPVLLTSLGQAADVHTMSVLAKRAKIPVEYKTLAGPDDVAKAKCVILNVGVSLKGFGAAGVNLDTETARGNALFKEAKAKGIPVIVTHIGGEERRDNMSNLLLETAMPQGDAFIVYRLGNKDEFFSRLAGVKPIILLDKTMEMVDVLKALHQAD